VSDDDGRIDNPAAIAEGWEPEVSVRPLRLHSPMVEGTLGGHCFSADFARYLAKVKPRLVVMWQMRVEYWWASPYGRARVQCAFLSRYGAERGAERYHVALCRASHYTDADGQPDATASVIEAQHTAWWAMGQVFAAQRFASARAA
jgi:hypothetical protein